MDNKRPRFLTIERVGEILHVKTPQIRSLLKIGELRGIQIGQRGLWRIGSKDLEEYIEAAYRRSSKASEYGDKR